MEEKRKYKITTISWDETRNDINSIKMIDTYKIDAIDPISAIKELCGGEDKFPDSSCFLKIEDLTNFEIIARLELEDKTRRNIA
jgi:hypothetical protein